MENPRREAARPYVPSGTLDLHFPPPLYSDDCVPGGAPLDTAVRQATRWKHTPMGRDAAGQLCYTGLTTEDPRETWFTMPRSLDTPTGSPIHIGTAASSAISKAFHLPPPSTCEAAFYDPVTPAQYCSPNTRWGTTLWRDRLIHGKEYVVNRNQFRRDPHWPWQGSDYVPHLSTPQRPRYTTQNFRHWNLEPYCPATGQRTASSFTPTL